MKIKGIVKKDQGRGKRLGFPTANLDLIQDLEDGIYVGLAKNKPALIFVGANVTFDEADRHIEAYILDFEEDLYGQELEIELIKKIRDNRKFSSPAELVDQMEKDELVAREFFGLSS